MKKVNYKNIAVGTFAIIGVVSTIYLVYAGIDSLFGTYDHIINDLHAIAMRAGLQPDASHPGF